MGLGCFEYAIQEKSTAVFVFPSGLAKQIREEIRINISKCMNESSFMHLNEAIEYFFLPEHITRIRPDKNKCVLGIYTNKMVQLRYCLGSFCLHQLFCMGKEFDCFTVYI